MRWLYNACMPNIQIKNVPDHVHLVLKRRAGAAGQSLQEYLLELLAEETTKPTWDEWLEIRKTRRGGRLDPNEVVEWIREDRESH